ncbi:MAG: hypothetical protein DRJ07_01570 [Bacteroidetes bacterium]|nr:MAG: hypothetical protein DRJ07_01570 [Bacteroidota bacterium]
MASIKFSIRNPIKNKRCSINYYVSIARGKRIRGSTNIKTLPKYWNPQTQLLRNKVEISNTRDDINEKLKKFDSFVYEKINSYHTNDLDEIQFRLKNDIEIFFDKKKKEDKPLKLLEFYDWYIEHYKSHPLPTTGNILGKGTAKTYKNAYRIIKEFNDTMYKLEYKSITVSFYDDFITFLTDQDYSLNYIGTQVKVLKTMMGSSFEKDLHQCLDFKKKYFKKPSEEVSNIYLTVEELEKIENVDFSDFKNIKIKESFILTKELAERARDLFLIGSFTGLRISDYTKLNSDNLIEEKGKPYLRVKSQKTRKFVTIPLHSILKAILNKRLNEFPKYMPDQHINYAIKEIGKIAKINDSYTKEITKGGKKVTFSDKKYKFICSHSARRSFCTNAYLSGMPVIDIMQISNHSTEKVFYNYIKLNDIEKAEKISSNTFFK